MDRSQVKNALTQVLENYGRAGVNRFSQSLDLDAAAIELLLQLPENAVEPAGDQPRATESPRAASNNLAESNAEATSSRSSSGNFVTPDVPQQAAAWSLPVLAHEDRQARFLALAERAAACRKCEGIVNFRQQTVFGAGNLKPEVCFIGEAPGADEDRQGEPFVGRAGQLLTKIIAAMKLTREEIYILNALKCRPPQNRTPVPDEIENCRGYAQAQLEVLQPKYIVCLGAVAVRSILRSTLSIGRLRGKFHDYCGAKVVVTYHPSYLLRHEPAKRMVWQDMQMLMADIAKEKTA